jgi:hypothetical protein
MAHTVGLNWHPFPLNILHFLKKGQNPCALLDSTHCTVSTLPDKSAKLPTIVCKSNCDTDQAGQLSGKITKIY